MKEQSMLSGTAIPVFVILLIATTLSWWVGESSGFAHTALIVIPIAFVKCLLVGLYFMEIIHAPAFLRMIMTAWCVAGAVGINGIYLIC